MVINNKTDPMDIDHAIEISDDSDQLQDFESKLKKAQMQMKFREAHLVSRQQVLFTVMEFNIQEREDMTKKQALQQIIKKEFEDIIDIEDGYFQPRREPGPDPGRAIPTELLVYGVDFLSNRAIKQTLFESLEPKIINLDNSHCKVTFPNAENCRIAIETNRDKSTEHGDSMSDELWTQLSSYEVLTFKRRVFCRPIFANELPIDSQNKKSMKYEEFKERRQKFEHQLVQEQTREYEKYAKYLQFEPDLMMNFHKRLRNGRKGDHYYVNHGRKHGERRDWSDSRRHDHRQTALSHHDDRGHSRQKEGRHWDRNHGNEGNTKPDNRPENDRRSQSNRARRERSPSSSSSSSPQSYEYILNTEVPLEQPSQNNHLSDYNIKEAQSLNIDDMDLSIGHQNLSDYNPGTANEICGSFTQIDIDLKVEEKDQRKNYASEQKILNQSYSKESSNKQNHDSEGGGIDRNAAWKFKGNMVKK